MMTHLDRGERSTDFSEQELARQTRFGAICQATIERMKDPTKYNQDLAAFKKHSTSRMRNITSHGRARMDTETRNISVYQCYQWEYMSHESHRWAWMQGA